MFNPTTMTLHLPNSIDLTLDEFLLSHSLKNIRNHLKFGLTEFLEHQPSGLLAARHSGFMETIGETLENERRQESTQYSEREQRRETVATSPRLAPLLK